MSKPVSGDLDVILDEWAAEVRKGRHAGAITNEMLTALTLGERNALFELLTRRELLRRASPMPDWIDGQLADIRQDTSPNRRGRLYRELAEEIGRRLRQDR